MTTHLRDLLAKATPGPWMEYQEQTWHKVEAMNGEGVALMNVFGRHEQAGRDAALIVYLVNHAEAIADLIDSAQKAQQALDGEIEQHEAFFLQTPSTNGEFDAIHRYGLLAAKRDLRDLRTALARLSDATEGVQ